MDANLQNRARAFRAIAERLGTITSDLPYPLLTIGRATWMVATNAHAELSISSMTLAEPLSSLSSRQIEEFDATELGDPLDLLELIAEWFEANVVPGGAAKNSGDSWHEL